MFDGQLHSLTISEGHPSTFPEYAFAKAREVPEKLELDHCVAVTKHWLLPCDACTLQTKKLPQNWHFTRHYDPLHRFCQPPIIGELPDRVLDLGSHGSSSITLVQGLGKTARYNVLSHCWKETGEEIANMTNLSIEQETPSTSLDLLSRTLHDAVLLTRVLGVQYLWIDVLCDPQHGCLMSESRLLNEAAIYSNSYLNIAATSSSTCNDGLFGGRRTPVPDRTQPNPTQETAARFIEVKLRDSDEPTGVYARRELQSAYSDFCSVNLFAHQSKRSPLLASPRFFQQRLLSPRILHVHAEELVWECTSNTQCECGNLDAGLDTSRSSYTIGALSLKRELVEVRDDLWVESPHNYHHMGKFWRTLMQRYTSLRFERDSDVLLYLSVIAKSLVHRFGGRYLAGMWASHLESELFWHNWSGPLTSSSETNTAPSWSWASLPWGSDKEMRITYRYIANEHLVKDTRLEILSASTTLAGIDSFGPVSAGLLKIKGVAVPAIIGGSDGFLHRPGHTDAPKHNVSLDYRHDSNNTEDIDVVCLLMGKQPYRDSENALILNRSERAAGAYKRIGVMSVRTDLEWFKGAVEHIFDIV